MFKKKIIRILSTDTEVEQKLADKNGANNDFLFGKPHFRLTLDFRPDQLDEHEAIVQLDDKYFCSTETKEDIWNDVLKEMKLLGYFVMKVSDRVSKRMMERNHVEKSVENIDDKIEEFLNHSD